MSENYSITELAGGLYWKQKRMDFTSGNLDYFGVHRIHTASTSDNNWSIWKFTWSGTNPTRIQGPVTGNWDGRSALGW